MSVVLENANKKTVVATEEIEGAPIAPVFLDDDGVYHIPEGIHISRAYSKEDRELFGIRDGETLVDAIVRQQREVQ